MTTVTANKPFSAPQKIKRPPPSNLQTSVNGTKTSNPSPSPSSASKRLPGQKQPPTTSVSHGVNVNGANARQNRQRKDGGRAGDQSTRLRLTTRNNALDGSGANKLSKHPEPHVITESYILKKFRNHPPSLIIHLHPSYFRFDQQEGSFSYHSEMRFIIEHLQKKTVPHDMLEELRNANVRFYDGWLIVRILDHKTGAPTPGSSSNSSSDDQVPHSIHNYTQYITPSPYVPFPLNNSKKGSSSADQQGEQDSGQESNGNATKSGKESQPSAREPKLYHIALRPTPLSRSQDILIDSMTPDPRSVNRKQSYATGRTPGSATAPIPPTPLSGIPPTPVNERGPPAKKIKMKVDARDLLDYEARIVNSTAPPLLLETVDSFESAQQLIESLRDPLHDELPPSPKGRKRTVAELAADEAFAKDEERFMTLMDDHFAAANAVGGANAAAVDELSGLMIFQPKFERWNTLKTILEKQEQRRAAEHEEQLNVERQKREKQEQENERRRIEQRKIEVQKARQAQITALNQQHAQAQALQAAASQTATNQHNMANPSAGLPSVSQQAQILRASQAQTSSPIVRTQTPHSNSSPVPGNMTQASHSIPMNVTSSNQGSGSPARPGSAMQQGHPGVAMARTGSQGQSHHGTPQMHQGTPAIRQATPAMRTATPIQRMSNASPHGSIAAQTPQMQQGVMATPQTSSIHMPPQQVAMLRQQQQQQQMLQGNQHLDPNQIAMLQARALQTAHQQQQQQAAMQAQNQMSPAGAQNNNQSAQDYAMQLRRLQAAQLQGANQQQQQLHVQAQASAHGSPPQHMLTPQPHTAQMHAQHSQQMHHPHQQQQQHQQLQAGHHPNGLSNHPVGQQNPAMAAAIQSRIQQAQHTAQHNQQQLFQSRFQQYREQMVNTLMQRHGGQPPQQQIDAMNQMARSKAEQDVKNWMVQNRRLVMHQQQNQQQQQQQGLINRQQLAMQMAAMQQQQQQQQQQQGQGQGGMPGGR